MSAEPFVLHPGMMDSGLQAIVGFSLATGSGNGGRSRSLPFELGTAEIYGCCAPRMWAVVRRVTPAGAGNVGCHHNVPCDAEGARLAASLGHVDGATGAGG